MALKAEGEEDKIILGAFGMIDYYFYFDRKAKNLKIFEENCFLRTKSLLRKKERILGAISSSLRNVKSVGSLGKVSNIAALFFGIFFYFVFFHIILGSCSCLKSFFGRRI